MCVDAQLMWCFLRARAHGGGRALCTARNGADHAQEQSRAVSMLNPLEKLLLTVSTFVLGRRHLRSLFVIYAAALHVFVFVVRTLVLIARLTRRADALRSDDAPDA